jgi:hypothetical protein
MGLRTAQPTPFEVEVATVSFKKYKSLGSNQIKAELIPVLGVSLLSEINSSIMLGIKKNCLSGRRYQLCETKVTVHLYYKNKNT